MLLLAQTGSVKIGEVVRYRVTYTPSRDRVLPSPEKLYVRIRNTSNIALRAAFVHGPYTLCVAAYPASYSPNEKFGNPRRYGVPSFEPMLKAGGVWECELVVPEDIRQNAATSITRGSFGGAWEPGSDAGSASWVVEVSSQVIFSTSAAVGYEILVARDEKSLNLSSATPVVGGQAKVPQAGRLSDYQQGAATKHGRQPSQTHGVFSRAVHVKVEDTAALWNSPRLPEWDDTTARDSKAQEHDDHKNKSTQVASTDNPGNEAQAAPGTSTEEKQKKVHLVILTHGLHSNLGADMLYMKESIDAAARQAKIDAQNRRAKKKAEREQRQSEDPAGPSRAESDTVKHVDLTDDDDDDDDDSDDEEVIVRGYSGNATKTEKGIKYLGKRLARYVLSMTYPDQPFLPLGKGAIEGFQQGLGLYGHDFIQTHKSSIIAENTIRVGGNSSQRRPFRITSISFIGHSLGGLVQTYAIAYIQKHSPTFFNVIKPINFIALASPFLGLSNENPLYVKFALDFGLVGRTGQDLGLTWRAPTIARSGWGAIVSNLGESAHKKVYGESQPESKPLLRILPTGPAHTALKLFRNRTVYSSVVNDGIVPLRTSCLLFLDWQGLGRVGKARRDAGLVETVVGFGWAELTGANSVPSRQKLQIPPDDGLADSGANTPVMDNGYQVPQPSSDAMAEDDRASLTSFPAAFAEDRLPDSSIHTPLSGFFNLFKSNDPPKEPTTSEKQKKIVQRGQTLKSDDASTNSLVGTTASLDEAGTSATTMTPTTPGTGKATSGHELENDPHGVVMVPPRTTFFESAGDLLNPKIPDVEYLLDPSKRPRTIFHDRVYHPSDIPPPPIKKRASGLSKMKFKTAASSSSSQVSSPIPSGSGASSPYLGIPHEGTGFSTKDYDDTAHTGPDKQPHEVVDGSNMRVEEKIARGYHRDLSWRKVLVKLEPDAHNNIVVRRMFTNAYGWPVMKHLVDAHFSDSAVARVRDDDERIGERALDIGQPPNEHGEETKTVSSSQLRGLVASEPTDAMEAREALDEVPDLPRVTENEAGMHSGDRRDSMSWSERDWIDSENESDADFMNDLAREEEDKAKQQQQQANKAKDGSQSPSGWNWAEKIVGKGATRNRSQSPATCKK